MPAPTPRRIHSTNAQVIAGELSAFLKRAPFRQVYFAEGDTPPPQLAFLVRFPRLSLTLKGCDPMEISMDGKSRLIEPHRGEVVFIPPNCWNKPTWERSVKVLHLLFGQKHLGISLVEHNGRSPEAVHAQMANAHRIMGGPIQDILNALVNLRTEPEKSPTDRLLVKALLHSTLRLLTESTPVAGSKARNTYDRICLYVQEHFQKEVTRESVAEEFHLNPNHLSRLFRQQGLMRFTDYLTWVRIDRAKFLLKHHELPLGAVAAGCGFGETAYFCRVFKLKTKQTPTEYRLGAAEEKADAAIQG